MTAPFGFMSLHNVVVLDVFGLVSNALYWMTILVNVVMLRDCAHVCMTLLSLTMGGVVGNYKDTIWGGRCYITRCVVVACGPSLDKEE